MNSRSLEATVSSEERGSSKKSGRSEPLVASNRILTVPNGLSLLRLLGIPVFVWLILGPEEYVWATAFLVVSGATDWFDGYLARVLNQSSKLGQLLDPAVDRLYIIATLLALVAADIVPWWLAVVIIGRDVFLFGLVPVLQRLGYTALSVSTAGKAATMTLLYAFPMLLLGAADVPGAETIKAIAWAFAMWGVGLYWLAAGLYVVQTVRLVRGEAAGAATAGAESVKPNP